MYLNTTGANAISGNLTVSGGTAKLLRADQIANDKSLIVSSGTFNIQGYNETVAGVQLTGGTISGSGGTLTSSSTFDMQAGSVAAILGGTVDLTKTGAGTVTLSAVNAYTGTTFINEGTLALSGAGSIAGSPTINIASNAIFDTGSVSGISLADGQTLKGSGKVAGGITIDDGGILSPGNSPGIFIKDGGTMTWGTGGTYIWEISDANGTAGTDWDLVQLINSAILDITAATGTFTLDLRYTGLGFDRYGTYAPWTIVDDADGSITGFLPSKFEIIISGFGDFVTADQFSVQSGSVQVRYGQSVPEPSTVVGVICVVFIIGLRRMRNSRKA